MLSSILPKHILSKLWNLSEMTRYVYAKEPVMYHANGLLVGDREMPTMARLMGGETKIFINKLLKGILTDVNPVGYHQCNSFCKRTVHFLLGYPHGCDVRSAVPLEMDAVVKEFEELIEEKIYLMEERVEMQSISIRLLPCSRYLEILDCAIYL